MHRSDTSETPLTPAALHLPGRPASVRVVAAMSGGVDSSVVAAILKRAGYDVVGITLQLYDQGRASGRSGTCCAGRDIADAKAVAAALGIPHYVLDYEARFAQSVIDPFADSYVKGETPVPCIACNQGVKFRDLLATARDLGAAALATGHYIASRPGRGGFELYRPADAKRDQSYFLFATTREQLDFLRFPLGGLAKAQVRALARAWQLPVADKADSQDICFVPEGGYARLIERLRPEAAEPGDIVHLDGRVLGRHAGIIHYTIGQRRGLGIAGGEPMFVVGLEPGARRVIVGPREALRHHRLILRDVNWLGDGDLATAAAEGFPVTARIRSTGEPRQAALSARGGTIGVRLEAGEEGVSPGQACVFYSDASPGARVLGGGWIVTSEADVERAPADRGSAARIAASAGGPVMA